MRSPWRPGRPKHEVAHRAWNIPDPKLLKEKGIDTRKTHCHKCLRPVKHPIHAKRFRETKNWFGWKGNRNETT